MAHNLVQLTEQLDALNRCFRDIKKKWLEEEDEEEDTQIDPEQPEPEETEAEVEEVGIHEDPNEWEDDEDGGDEAEGDEEDEEYDFDGTKKEVSECLQDLCRIAQEASDLPDSPSSAIIKRISELEDSMVNFAFTTEVGEALFDYIPPFCGNLAEDKSVGIGIDMGAFEELLRITIGRSTIKTDMTEEVIGDRGRAYNPDSAPSPHTSPLARFRPNGRSVPNGCSDEGRAILEARMEMSACRIGGHSTIASSKSVIAVLDNDSKGQNASLTVASTSQPFDDKSHPTVRATGLTGTGKHIVVDEEQYRIAVADQSRIKTYKWEGQHSASGTSASGEEGTRKTNISLLPLHTLDSSEAHGPIGSMDHGNVLVRAGKKTVAVWNMDKVPTHGPTGTKTVGKKLNIDQFEDVDNPDAVELSSGSKPNRMSRLEADIARAEISTWGNAPSALSSTSFICGFSSEFRCMHVDLEMGKIGGRYVGHGGRITHVGSSGEDPHAFVTTATDGVVRLYDVRQPTPTFAAYTTDEPVFGATLALCDGQPLLFTGGTKTELITCWDVRAKKPLYELSTGNNQVTGLSWNPSTRSLYAATSCPHIDAPGNPTEMRSLRLDRIPGPRRWPKKAFHNEKFFGVPYDAGGHRLYRYAFNPDATPTIIPKYGS